MSHPPPPIYMRIVSPTTYCIVTIRPLDIVPKASSDISLRWNKEGAIRPAFAHRLNRSVNRSCFKPKSQAGKNYFKTVKIPSFYIYAFFVTTIYCIIKFITLYIVVEKFEKYLYGGSIMTSQQRVVLWTKLRS